MKADVPRGPHPHPLHRGTDAGLRAGPAGTRWCSSPRCETKSRPHRWENEIRMRLEQGQSWPSRAAPVSGPRTVARAGNSLCGRDSVSLTHLCSPEPLGSDRVGHTAGPHVEPRGGSEPVGASRTSGGDARGPAWPCPREPRHRPLRPGHLGSAAREGAWEGGVGRVAFGRPRHRCGEPRPDPQPPVGAWMVRSARRGRPGRRSRAANRKHELCLCCM